MNDHKVFIVGLDGADWSILDKLMSRGAMPTLASLVSGGARGTLFSTIPPVTPVAWASFQTGTWPAKHGVIDFVQVEDRGRVQRVVTARSIRTKTVWEYLNEYGCKAISVNVPLTYPPFEIDGCMISGMFTPSLDSPFTHPPELKQELETVTGGYRLLESGHKQFNTFDVKSRDGLVAFVEFFCELIDIRTRAALYLRDSYPWDLFMVHFQAVDALQHPCWAYLEEDHPEFNRSMQDVVVRFYVELDARIAKLVDGLPEGTLIVLMSDHGFQRNRGYVYINNWLANQGWLALSSASRTLRRDLARLAYSVVTSWEPLRREARKLLKRIAQSEHASQELLLSLQQAEVDWSRSQAYARTPQYAYIYLVDRVDVEGIRSKLSKELLTLKLPGRSESPVSAVLGASEVWSSDKLIREVPDLVIEPYAGFIFSDGLNQAGLWRVPIVGADYDIGIHRREGIVVFAGEVVSQSVTFAADIVDIVPTILYYLGLPVPTSMDGKVLLEVFRHDFRLRNLIQRESDSLPPVRQQEHDLTQDEEAQVKERLRALGYLD